MNNRVADNTVAGERRTPPGTLSFQTAADKAHLEEITNFLEEALDKLNVRGDVRGHICVAFDEAITNVAMYAYRGSKGDIWINVNRVNDRIMIEIEDSGLPFNPLNQPEPDTTASIDKRIIGGLGIHLMRHMMDELNYKRVNDKNYLSMTKKIPEAQNE